MTEQEVQQETQKETVKSVEKRKPRKRSTRSIEYYMVVEVNSRHVIDKNKVKEIMDSVIGDVVRFVSFPLKQRNTFFVYVRRGAKKRVYDNILTGAQGKMSYKCTLVDLKKGDEQNVINPVC